MNILNRFELFNKYDVTATGRFSHLDCDAVGSNADLAVLVAISRYFALGISTVSTRVDDNRSYRKIKLKMSFAQVCRQCLLTTERHKYSVSVHQRNDMT